MANEFKVKNGLIVSGSADIEQDLRVRGTLTVDEFHTSITTSSIIYESGSTRFGNSLDDIHTLTGSVNITGSISLNGQAIGTGKLDEEVFNTYTSSYKVSTASFNNLTTSYNSFTTSYISDSSSFNSRIGGLESFSSSLDVTFVNETEFGSFSSSMKNFTSSLNSYTNSLENRLSIIESSTSSLNTHTSSTNTRLTSIESTTSSLNSFTSSTAPKLSAIETSTGSLNTFTSSINTTIKNKLNSDGVISGSSQILSNSNIVSSSLQVTAYGFAITGSNTFKGDQYVSGSVIPTIDNAFDLGSPQYQWRDVYISSGSLYIDNTKVLSSTAQELTITTDSGQSIKILEGTTDSIILQTADGDIELKSSADGDILLDPTNGKIMLKGPVEILNGNKIQSSIGGTPVVFASDIVVSGSIDITGTIEGIDLTAFSSSVNSRLSSLESSGGSLNTFTASALTRLNSLENTTSSLNSYSSSNNTRLGVIESTTGSLNSFTSSANTRLNSLESASGSIRSDFNTYTSSNNSTNTTQNSRLNSLESTTGSLNSYTSSTNTRLSTIETATSSLNTFTGSINTTIKSRLNAEGVISGSGQIDITQTTNYTSFSSSLATTDLNQTNKISAIESTTSSLNTYTSSANSRFNTIESTTSSLNTYTSSANSRFNTIESTTSSLNTFTSSANSRLNSIETSTSSLNSYTTSANTKFSGIESVTSSFASYSGTTNNRLNNIETSTGSLNTFSSSTNTRLLAIETSTSSLNSFTSSINTTIKNRLNTENVISGSAQVTLSNTTGYSTFSSSLATTDAGQDTRLTSLEGKTGSYATTGSNIFQGNQIITGSLFVSQDLIIAGSSSIQHISSSVVNIADNIITVNAQNPSIRFGGLAVIDSGSSPQVSGSMLFDSVNDQWIFVHQNQSTVTSSILLMGPQTFNNLGNETFPTTNRLLKSVNAEHLGDSNITDTGTKVSVNSNTEITGSLITTGNVTSNTNLISNYSAGDEGGEISLNKPVTNTTLNGGITIDVWRDRVRIFETSGTNRGGFFNIAGLSAGVGTNFLTNAETASFVEYSNVANKPTLVSGSSQINHNTTTNYDANQHVDHTTVSITAGNGLSGGGTIAATRTLTLDTGSVHFLDGVKKELNTEGVISGSSQITYSGLSGIPSGIVSGSSQITYSGLSGIPSGIISGSVQVDLTSTTNYVSGIKTRLNTENVLSSSAQVVSALPAGTVSGSSQVLNGTTIHSGAFFNGITVVSGSGQISFGGITGVPSGLVSGSSQVSYPSLSNIPSGIVSGSSQVTYSGLSGIPSGIVSGSSQVTYSGLSGVPSGIISGSVQVDLTATTNYSTGIKTRLNAEGVLSSSAQVVSSLPAGTVSGSSQITYGSISGIPSGIVSGSSQITYGSISGIPSGIVSGSSQVSFPSLSNIPGGLVSGSSQIDLTATTNYSTGIKTRLNAEGVLSGSAQVSFGSISGIPSGLVSGSSQITISSTTGYGSVLNQAVLTSSSPTFAGLTSTSNINSNGILLGSDTTYGNPYRVVGFNSTADGGNRILAATGTTDGMYFMASTGNGFNFRPNGGTGNLVNISSTGGLTAVGLTSTAGISVSGASYYTFNKPSTTNFQTVALFGSTTNGIFLTSDSGIISRGAYFNGGWIATDTYGAYLNFNTSTGGMNLHVFSGATVGGAASTTNIFTVARNDFSFNGNTIWHAGNDGAGSGLDADLLDGYSETSFIRIASSSSSPTNGTFAIGSASGRNFIQSHNSQPLDINPLGNNVFVNGNQVVTNTGSWGINITGNAATVTNGVYTTGDQTISGTKTFGVIRGDSGSDYPHSFTNTDAGNTHWTNRGNRLLTSNGTNWAADGRDPIMAIVGSTSATTRGRMIGLTLHNDDTTNNAFSPMLSFSSRSDSGSYNTVYASISGRKTGSGSGLDTNWAKGELHFYVHGDAYVADTPTLRMTNTQSLFATSISTTTSLAVNTGNNDSSSTGGITLWDGGGTTTSWIGFKHTGNSGWGNHGAASGYATYFVMDTANRGWIFRFASNGGTDFTGTNVASISNTGRFAANEGYQFTFNGTNRGGIYGKRTWFGTGSDYSPSICAEGGLSFNIYVDGSTTKGATMDTSGHFYPVGSGSQNLGGSSNRWATVFTSDLSLSNGIGDYTIVEGEEKLYLYNNKNNKVYSFVLQEEDPATATPKKS